MIRLFKREECKKRKKKKRKEKKNVKEKLTVIRTHEKIRIPLVHFHRDNLHRNLESSPIEPASYKERFISESRPTPTSATLLSDAREFYKGTFPFLFFSFFYSTVAKATIRLPAMPAVTTINNRNRSRIGWESEHRQKQARTAN